MRKYFIFFVTILLIYFVFVISLNKKIAHFSESVMNGYFSNMLIEKFSDSIADYKGPEKIEPSIDDLGSQKLPTQDRGKFHIYADIQKIFALPYFCADDPRVAVKFWNNERSINLEISPSGFARLDGVCFYAFYGDVLYKKIYAMLPEPKQAWEPSVAFYSR